MMASTDKDAIAKAMMEEISSDEDENTTNDFPPHHKIKKSNIAALKSVQNANNYGTSGVRRRNHELPVESSEEDEVSNASEHRFNSRFGASNAASNNNNRVVANDARTAVGVSNSSTTSMDAKRRFLLRPTSINEGFVQCYVIRTKKMLNLGNPSYALYLETDDQFLVAAKKRGGKRTSNYLLSMDEKAGDRKSPLNVAKLRASWAGSFYTIYDHGMRPDKAVTDSSLRKELGIVEFDYDALGPGKMQVAIPRVSSAGAPTIFKPRREDETLAARVESKSVADLVILRNKRPAYDSKSRGYVLEFNGRVTKSSIKNFQLCSDEFGDETLLQFGRVDDNKFTLDFRYPLSPIQAFSIILASLDPKIADTKSYERMKHRNDTKK